MHKSIENRLYRNIDVTLSKVQTLYCLPRTKIAQILGVSTRSLRKMMRGEKDVSREQFDVLIDYLSRRDTLQLLDDQISLTELATRRIARTDFINKTRLLLDVC